MDKVLQKMKEVEHEGMNAVSILAEPVLDEALLVQVSGGFDRTIGSGWLFTISGECNGGSSCNPF